MKLRRIVSIASLCAFLFAATAPMRAQFFEDKSKKEAKELFDKAKKEDNDRAKQVRDLCQAASLQPKEKKYSDACSSYTAGLNHDDEAALASALLAYNNHDLDKAETFAKEVSSYDPKLVAKANLVLNAVKSDRNVGQSVEQIKTAWEKGDFATVTSLAQTMNTPATKNAAAIYVRNVQMYNQYIEDAMKQKDENPAAAKELLGRAYMLNPNGPAEPKQKITDIDNALAAKSNSPYFGNKANGNPANGNPGKGDNKGQQDANGAQPTNPADVAKKVTGLLNDAHNAEKQGNSAAAIGDYASVLKLQPDNKDAQAGQQRLQQAIKTDPAAANNELRSAIRSFYNGQFDDASTALTEYLGSPQTAQNPGAADFYLGASLIARSILRRPHAQWTGPSAEAIAAFKAARKSNYNPVRAYVSPTLLAIWDSTAK